MEDNVSMWDKTILTDRTILANRPDLIILNINEQNCLIVDVAIPDDVNVLKKKRREEVEIQRSADRNFCNVECQDKSGSSCSWSLRNYE